MGELCFLATLSRAVEQRQRVLWLECEDTEEGTDDAVLADSGKQENGK